MKEEKIFAMYKGDELLYIGTHRELAEQHGVSPRTITHYKTPSYKKRTASWKGKGNYITIVELDDDDET